MMFLWVPGLAVVFERPGRRKELAAYCLTHALNSVWGALKQRKGVKPRDWFSVVAITLSLGVILQHHKELPKLVTRLLGINK